MARTGFTFAAPTALAYEPTRWESYLWNERSTLATVRNAVQEVRDGMTAANIEHESADGRALDAGHAFGGEVFSRLYGNPSQVEQPVSWAARAMKITEGLDGWQQLRGAVEGDPDFAALATSQILSAVAPQLAKLADEEGRNPSAPGEADDGEETPAGTALRAAMRRALAGAVQTTADTQEAMSGIAPGLAERPSTHGQRDTRRARLAERLMVDPKVQDVLRKAGRLQRLAERQNRTTDPHGISTIVGIENGGDIGRMLPTEAMSLLDEDMEALFAARLAERSLMQFRATDRVPLSNGPMVILVDESGSMKGNGELWAHAAVVAAIGRARRDKRSCAVVTFNGHVTGAWEVRADGSCCRMSTREPVVQPGQLTIEEVILEMLTRHSDGGTSFAPPLRWAAAYLTGRVARADVVIVTDGEADMPAELLEAYQTIVKADGRIFGITVNGGSVSGTVRALCTMVVDVDRAADLEGTLARAVPARTG